MVFSTFTNVNSLYVVIQPPSRLGLGFGFQKSWPCIYRREALFQDSQRSFLVYHLDLDLGMQNITLIIFFTQALQCA